MLKRQERAIDQVIQLRVRQDDIQRRVDVGVYRAVRVQGVPVAEMARRLKLTRQRIYQMIHNAEDAMEDVSEVDG